MPSLCVDLVLLPPASVSSKVIAINHELVKKFGRRIVLGKRRCFPHITLAMGCIKKSDLKKINTALLRLSKDFLPIKLSITGVYYVSFDGALCCSIRIKKTKKLVALRKRVLVEAKKYFRQKASSTGFVGSVNKTTVDWVNNYFSTALKKSFEPHITVGFGETKKKVLGSFYCNRLALCQLGEYGTCAKELN